jgi:hypothetical protein
MGVLPDVERVMVEEHAGVQGLLVKDADTPVGSPEALSVTG